MEEHCTCGAKTVEDARFCHRCGRPLRDEPLIEALEEPVVSAEAPLPQAGVAWPAGPATPAFAEISFRNGAAVRTGFVAALLLQLVLMLTAAAGASILMPLVLLGGGSYSVFLYRRRTGNGLTILNGARIGWITGVLAFVIMTVLFTIGVAMLAGSDELMKAYKESASSFGLPQESAEQVRKLLENPTAFGFSIFLGLLFQFLMLTLICSVGGALGAKLMQPAPPRRD